jgi:SAM-dependent methyltransferase
MGRMPNDHNPPGGISTRLVSFSADSADPPGVNDYDSFAEAYTASNENNLINAYYERPAMLALAGDVAGRRILDAGCGAGPVFAALRDRGAIVTGIDKSAGMLELARRRLAENLWHREAGLEPDYFATYNYIAEWTAGGQTALLRFWTRPLHAMTDAFTAAGFRISVISEPAVAPDTPRELLPGKIADRRRFLCFLFFVLQAD